LGVVGHGKEIHREVIASGFQTDVFVGSALVDMYSKCGSLQNARQMFDKITERDVVLWNTMIAAYSQNGYVEEALKLFQKMPDQDVGSWSGMIAGYLQNGLSEEALKLFDQMLWKGIRPDQYAFASVLKACAEMKGLNRGKKIHEEIIKTGYGINVFVGSALVDMYGKCGSIEDARDVFDKLPNRNVVSWSAMIAVFAQNGHFDGALNSFKQMQLTSVKPNSDVFASVLSACANLAALEYGKEVHGRIIKSVLQSDVFVGSALVDMYAKCGNIEDAYKAFERMPTKNNVSWNAMIAGYAIHGYGKQAVELFERMQLSGMKPDDVTFIGILSACCHAGLVEDGLRYFDSMSQYYQVMPMIEHYCCMVDLLGRAGHLDEAKDLIQKMPVEPNANIWRSLLGSCKIYTNIDLGEWAAERLFQLDPKNSAAYVLLSNIYAAAGRWDDIVKVRKMTQDRMVQKEPGCSWIEVNKIVHTFLVGN
jgi:pentatricopeptide repeat protein